MENFRKEDKQMDLPPGFRFHPTDEELITHYLYRKVLDSCFSAGAIGEVDMNKVEPWELPWLAKIGEKEWYFFAVRDKKYPTGLRTNRATASGYWKATGKDKEIFRGKSLVGMKKTLVFYKGRAPRGEKTNWVIHEYRLEGKISLHNLPKTAKNEWVICRVFQKTAGGKKVHISGLVKLNSVENEFLPSTLPPLTEAKSVHVPCFSNPIDTPKCQEDVINYISNPLYSVSSNPTNSFPRIPLPNMFLGAQHSPFQGNLQFQGSIPMPNQAILKGLLENYGPNTNQRLKTEKEMVSASHETGLSTDMNAEISSVMSNLDMGRRSFEDQEPPSTSVRPLDFDCLWSY